MWKTKAKCPKCRSNNLTLIEHCDYTASWEQINGEIANAGEITPQDVTGIFGECNDCGWTWKFRCLQITGLIISE